jgi:hypothetical protein
MQRDKLIGIASIAIVLCLAGSSTFGQSKQNTAHRFQLKNPPVITHGPMSTTIRKQSMLSSGSQSSGLQLPVFNYQVVSSRDGNLYQGVIVGRDPKERGSNAQVNVTTQVVPIVLKFRTLGTAVDLNTGIITTVSGRAKSDPTVADTGCLARPNNVPLTLLTQSPILKNADFIFGGTDVGNTQYTDAFQRASFWMLIDRSDYHVRLGPVSVLPPLVVNVPAASGLSLAANVFEPTFSMCSPEGIVDINFLDAVVVDQLTKLPGVNPGTFPMFMIYNTGMSIGDPTNLGNCCAGGYHSINPAGPITFQTYSPFDFDVSGFFVPSANDTAIVSHEAGEWINDPYVINDTPAWGHTGQVGGCQNNLEVGDPLTGMNAGSVVMPNGFTYHLQELAFFSWFFGNPSLGVHRWDSDNATFVTDAGPVCQ